jgi:SAM-dependent methyltransferase
MESSRLCPWCLVPLMLAHRQLPGYQRGTSCDILACQFCDVQLADWSSDPTPIYNAIYRYSNALPGYSRYHEYAAAIKSAPDPLGYLALNEYMYAFIRDILRLVKTPHSVSVLEVGCGLGYLTYALADRGFKVTGIDVSADAISRACDQYGDLFECCTCEQLAEQGRRFDIVIATEVIEHVMDPVAFCKAVRACLTPMGQALLTTPNRTYFPRHYIWNTELPPVHLWWLSEEAMRLCAHAAGLATRLWHYVSADPPLRDAPTPTLLRGCEPVLDEHGGPCLTGPLGGFGSARRLAGGVVHSGIVWQRRLLRSVAVAVNAYRHTPYVCTDTDRFRHKTMGVVLTPHRGSYPSSDATGLQGP